MKFELVNDVKIRPVKLKQPEDKRPIKGFALFPELYCIAFFVARKKSGKTTVLAEALRRCASKKTVVIAFVATINSDPAWLAIQDQLEQRGIEFRGYTSISDEDGDHLKELVHELQELAKQRVAKERRAKEPKAKTLLFDSDSEDEDAPRKSKYQSPEYMIVFDDISGELRSLTLKTLMKNHRHYRTKILISSQYLKDLQPEQRKQIDYWLLFSGLQEPLLETIHNDSVNFIDFDQFQTLYQAATAKPFDFLYVDHNAPVKQAFRRNFNEQILLDKV